MTSLSLVLALILVSRVSCDAGVGLQSIVPSESAARASNNWTSMAEALDIFSVRNLDRNWPPSPGDRLTRECERDVSRYLQGLKRQELWALKSEFLVYHCFARCRTDLPAFVYLYSAV